MTIIEYSSGQYCQVIPRKSKMLEYLGYEKYSRWQKLEISRNSKLFCPTGRALYSSYMYPKKAEPVLLPI